MIYGTKGKGSLGLQSESQSKKMLRKEGLRNTRQLGNRAKEDK